MTWEILCILDKEMTRGRKIIFLGCGFGLCWAHVPFRGFDHSTCVGDILGQQENPSGFYITNNILFTISIPVINTTYVLIILFYTCDVY